MKLQNLSIIVVMDVIIMKMAGIVRRIDELGRIVIPKEVRKRLRMDSGDLVDISILDENVVLTKFHPLNHDAMLLSSFCESLKETFHSDIIITNVNSIIYNTLDDCLNNEELNGEFKKRVNSFLEKEMSGLTKLNLTDTFYLNRDFIIYEIKLAEEHYGYLLLLDDMIGKKQKELANLILNYVNKILKN